MDRVESERGAILNRAPSPPKRTGIAGLGASEVPDIRLRRSIVHYPRDVSIPEEVRTTSIVAPDQKRPWILIAAAIILVLAVAVTIAAIDLPGERLISRGEPAPQVAPALPQAAWKMNVKPSGVDGKLSPAAKKAVGRQGPQVRALVKRVYDSLFVRPKTLPVTLKQSFTGPAAVAFKRAGAGVSEAGRASTTLRRASIGIQAEGARTAVAAVTVRAVGDTAGATPVLHRSTLWLERAESGWKVVAFNVQQALAPTAPATKAKGRDGKAGSREAGSQDGAGKNGARGSGKKDKR